jgi:DNA replication protein DnaC
MCKCLLESKAKAHIVESDLTRAGIKDTMSFNNFTQHDGTDESYRGFYDIAFSDNPKPLLLCYGVPGNGKTHLCNALGIVLVSKRYYVRLWNVADLFSYFKQNMETLERRVGAIKGIQALILDDLRKMSDWESERFDEIINYRYSNSLITVVTTNLDLSQLSDRVQSRFRDTYLSTIVLNRGGDCRPLLERN